MEDTTCFYDVTTRSAFTVIKVEETRVRQCFNQKVFPVQCSHTVGELPIGPAVGTLYLPLVGGLFGMVKYTLSTSATIFPTVW